MVVAVAAAVAAAVAVAVAVELDKVLPRTKRQSNRVMQHSNTRWNAAFRFGYLFQILKVQRHHEQDEQVLLCQSL